MGTCNAGQWQAEAKLVKCSNLARHGRKCKFVCMQALSRGQRAYWECPKRRSDSTANAAGPSVHPFRSILLLSSSAQHQTIQCLSAVHWQKRLQQP